MRRNLYTFDESAHEISYCPIQREYVYVDKQPVTNATRQAAFKARQLASGLVHRSMWVHPDDWAVVKQFAAARKQARETHEKQQKGYNQP